VAHSGYSQPPHIEKHLLVPKMLFYKASRTGMLSAS